MEFIRTQIAKIHGVLVEVRNCTAFQHRAIQCLQSRSRHLMTAAEQANLSEDVIIVFDEAFDDIMISMSYLLAALGKNVSNNAGKISDRRDDVNSPMFATPRTLTTLHGGGQ